MINATPNNYAELLRDLQPVLRPTVLAAQPTTRGRDMPQAEEPRPALQLIRAHGGR